MNNITLRNDEYTNIQGVSVKKIKLTRPNLDTLMNEGRNSRIEVKVEPQVIANSDNINPVVEEVKHEEEMPLYLNERELKTKDYSFDETALKERVAENYKNLANFERKTEKVSEISQRPSLNEKVANFEKLLATDVIIMQDKMDMFRKVFNEKQLKLQNAKQEQARYADSYRRISNEEQVQKISRDAKYNRSKDMNNKNNFTFLTIGESESGEIVEAISMVNESLKNLYNVNQKLYKEDLSKIERYEFDKKEINKASEKVGAEIHKYADDLSKFIDEKTSSVEDIIKVDNQYKDAQKESDRAIRDEYDAIRNEENAKVGINLTMPTHQEAMQNLNQSLNVFENFRRAASEGGDEAAVSINEPFAENFEDVNDLDQSMSFRRMS